MQTNQSVTYYKNQFLIAMPQLADPNFFHSVTYICEHNQDGAMGVVINVPLDISVFDLLSYMKIPSESKTLHHLPVISGGPVQADRGFVIHRSDSTWQSTLQAHPDIHITTSRDILISIANEQGPQDYLIALGYAGWEAGQLEEEMSKNLWLNCDLRADIFFDIPIADRWQEAAKLMGVNLTHLSSDIGHA